MSSSFTYNPRSLQKDIDAHRIASRWSQVVPLIERFAHLMDLGADQTRTPANNQTVTDLIQSGGAAIDLTARGYYWLVMAEILVHDHDSSVMDADRSKALDAISKAAENDSEYKLWRVVLSKMLLLQLRVPPPRLPSPVRLSRPW